MSESSLSIGVVGETREKGLAIVATARNILSSVSIFGREGDTFCVYCVLNISTATHLRLSGRPLRRDLLKAFISVWFFVGVVDAASFYLSEAFCEVAFARLASRVCQIILRHCFYVAITADS